MFVKVIASQSSVVVLRHSLCHCTDV